MTRALKPPPSPEEILQAHKTLSKAAAAMPYDAFATGGTPIWDGLIEGRRMLNVATSLFAAAADDDEAAEAYQAAWEKMVDGNG